jgi:hypothetical protein
MTKQPYGPATPRIRQSRGPCNNNSLSMYQTSYANSYSEGVPTKHAAHPVHKIRVVKRPTGYKANFRPCTYYSPNMDDVDNPALKMIPSRHYETGNEFDYKPYMISKTGEEMDLVQHDILPNASGFTTMNDKAFIEPTSHVVSSVHGQNCPVPKLKQQSIDHDPIAAENSGTGPAANSTENSTRYTGRQGRWASQSWRFHKSVGKKEPTANTRVEHVDPVEHLSKNPYRHDLPSSKYFKTNRGTGLSEQHSEFQRQKFHKEMPKENADGIAEPVPTSQRTTGYSHETTKPRYTDWDRSKNFNNDNYLSPNRSDAYSTTLARYSFHAPKLTNSQLDDGIGRRHVGNKEATGYVKNHPSYKRCNETNGSRFETHYGSRFGSMPSGEDQRAACNSATLALSCSGWPVSKAQNGFTKSTRVHAFTQ